MNKAKRLVVKTVKSGIETEAEKERRELARLLFYAAGHTGGRFKIEAAEAERYAASSGDLTIVYENSSRDNGDVYITILRDRDK